MSGRSKKTGKEKRKRINLGTGIKVLILSVAFIFIASGLFLLTRFGINEYFIRRTGTDDPPFEKERLLTGINVPEGRKVYYNLGVAYYEAGLLADAEAMFSEAERYEWPEGEECPLKVDHALSIVRQIDLNHLDTEESVSRAIERLKEARSLLTENGCASDAGEDGHSPEAEQLKKEIDDLLRQLEQKKNEQQDRQDQGDKQQQQQQDQQQGGEKKEESSSEREKGVRDKLGDGFERSQKQHNRDRIEEENREEAAGREAKEKSLGGKDEARKDNW